MDFEESLLAMLKAGDADAFGVFVDRVEAPLYRFFLCDHRDHHLAEEQTAETLVQLVRSLPNMRGDCTQLRAFVFATARHVQQRRWRRRPMPQTSLDATEIPSDRHPSPLDQAADCEQLERTLQAMSTLEEPLRNVLLLRFVEDCTIQEIAQSLEMPLGTVKSHIHRGRIRLKRVLLAEECET